MCCRKQETPDLGWCPKWEKTPDLGWHLFVSTKGVSCGTTTGPHALGERCMTRSRSFLWPLSVPSERAAGRGGNWVPKKLAGCHQFFIHQEQRVTWLCYATGFGLPDLRRGLWSPAKSSMGDTSSWPVTLNSHLHNQSAYCIDFDWRGFKS